MSKSEIITFKPSSKLEWQEKILSDLKGKSIESIKWKSEVGELDSFLFDFNESQQLPGVFPFQRGYVSASNQWKLLVSITCDNSKLANQLMLKSLSEGANAVRLINPNVNEFSIVFEEVMLDIIHVQIVAPQSQIPEMISAFISYCSTKSYSFSELDITFFSDPIGDYFKSGLKELSAYEGSFLINVNAYAQGGAAIDRQIGLALAHGHEYLVRLIELGISPNDAVKRIEFNWAVGTTYFLEIAKLRAFRAVWSFILANYGVKNELCITKIHSQTSNFQYSNLDVHTNLLRATTSAMAAVIGGTDSLEVLPYDFNLSKDKKASDSQRLAINIQLILQEEGYLNQVIDAAGGSYFIESITEELKQKGYELFQNIEKEGGIVNYFEKGQLLKELNEDLDKKKESFKSGETVLVGVNKFPNSKEVNSEEVMTDFCHTTTLKAIRLAQL